MKELQIPVVDHGVTFTEIPDETALFFELGNCTCHCKECHSPELWDLSGTGFTTKEEIFKVVEQYKDFVTAVLFMGGNNNKIDFKRFLHEVVEPISKELPVGIYMGKFTTDDFVRACKHCRWVKVGRYIANQGGLDKESTNQIFVEVQNYKFMR